MLTVGVPRVAPFVRGRLIVMKVLIRVIFALVTAGYWAVMFKVTHLPPADLGPPGTLSDKQLHFLAYLALSFLLGLTLVLIFPGRRGWIPLALVLTGMTYGALDELTQPLVGRTCDIVDWTADIGGAGLAAVGIFCLQRLRWPAGARAGSSGIVAPPRFDVVSPAAGDARA